MFNVSTCSSIQASCYLSSSQDGLFLIMKSSQFLLPPIFSVLVIDERAKTLSHDIQDQDPAPSSQNYKHKLMVASDKTASMLLISCK